MKKIVYILLLASATTFGQIIIPGSGQTSQALTLTGNTLNLSNGGSVDLTPYLDNTDSQTITDFSLSGNILTLTISDGNTVTVDLSGVGGIQEVNTTTDLSSISTPTTGQRAIVTGGIEDEVFIYDAAQSGTNNGATVFDGWVRQFDGVYLKPQWFGAAMDGVTNDRDAFVTTIDAANTLGLKVKLDKDIYIDAMAIDDSIFINNNTTIEGEGNPIIYTENEYSPLFHIPLSNNVLFKGFTIEWIGSYDVLNYDAPSGTTTANQQRLEDWLIANRGMTFNSTNPYFNGDSVFKALFVIDGASNVTIEDVVVRVPDGATANEFIPWVVKVKSQYDANSTVNNETTASRTQANNLVFKNMTIDGALMGIQGNANDVVIENLIGKRYTDAQDVNGDYVGGNDGSNTYTVAPPHLIYLIPNQNNDPVENIKLLNIIDYGEYVGTPNVRATESGYCPSLTLNQDVSDVLVDGYKSYRRDGFAGIVNITDAVFRNIYSESYNASLFGSIQTDFTAFRQNGQLTNVMFENVILKDLSATSTMYPMSPSRGDNVKMNNVHLYVKELGNVSRPAFGYQGNNNTITNSYLHIENHTGSGLQRVVEIQNGLGFDKVGKGNIYEIDVYGWKGYPNSNPTSEMIRHDLLFDSDNPNHNKVVINDVSNNYSIKNIDGKTEIHLTRVDTITVGTSSNKKFNITMPSGYAVKSITAQTIQAITSGSNFSIGTGGASTQTKQFWIKSLTGSTETLTREINETVNASSERNIFLFSDGSFSGVGKVKIKVDLVRYVDADSKTIATSQQYYPTTVTTKKTLTDADFSAAANYKSQLFNITSDTLELGDGVTATNYNKPFMIIPSSATDTAYIKPVDGDSFRILNTNTAFTADGIVLTGNEVATIFKTGADTWIVSASAYTEHNEVATVYNGANAADPNNEVNGVANIDVDANSSVSSSVEQVQNGTYSIKVEKTVAAANNIYLNLTGLTAGQNYTVSAYVYRVEAGGNLDIILDDAENWQTDVSDRNEFDNTGVWDLLTVTGQATATTARIRFNQTSTTSPKTWYLDNVTVTQ